MKKKILYFKELKFQKENLKVLKKKFKIIYKKKLTKNEKKEIISIFLPMNAFYSKKFFCEFRNLRSVVSPTTGDIHLDKEYLLKSSVKIVIHIKHFILCINFKFRNFKIAHSPDY